MSFPNDIALRIYENRIIAQATSDFTGSMDVPFQVLSGSRLLVTLRVDAIDPGTVITCTLQNSIEGAFPLTAPITLGTFSATAVGPVRQIYTDYNNFFNFNIVVSGGNAQFKVAVALFDNAINTTIANADIHVEISDKVDSDGHYSSTRIGDGVNQLRILPDGDLPVELEEGSDAVVSTYAQTPSPIVAGITTDVVTYTAPASNIAYLQRVECSGENIAEWSLELNGTVIAYKRTWFGGGLDTTFEFSSSPKRGYPMQAGDVLVVKVNHYRPAAGLFDARIQVVEFPLV